MCKITNKACSVLGLVLSIYLSGCAHNPATGSADFVLMSEKREIEIGKESHQKIIKSQPVYDDEKIQSYVDRVGQKIAKVGERPDLKYTFTVIDSPQINAFALPGGYIYINRGLMAYMKTEAQLAAVLAHELAHVTARHAVRQDTARTGAKALTFLSVLTTGSYALGDVAGFWGSAAVKGYGRDMELEADGIGARYLAKAGYDPQAMIEVISILKDQEKFTRLRTAKAGKKPQSYHGLFSSHPRNDKRLKEVISAASELKQSATPKTELVANYREQMEGLIYGPSYRRATPKKTDENRFTHNRLGFSLVFPKDWEVANEGHTIVANAPDSSAKIHMEVARKKENLPPGHYLRKYYSVPLLIRSEDFSQKGMLGHTGIRPADDQLEHDSRVAILYRGSLIYMIQGEVYQPDKEVDYDKIFLNSIQSFTPARGKRSLPKPKTISYIQATKGMTFANLAKRMRIGRYAEEQLRLINGYYPRGEPKEGEWLKIIK